MDEICLLVSAFPEEDGSVRICTMQAEPEEDFRSRLLSLKQWLRDQAESRSLEAAGIAFEVFLHSPDGGKQDAIQLAVEHADGRAVDEFIPFSKSPEGTVTWGDSFRASRERELFGFPGFTLTLENRPQEKSPTLLQLRGAARHLTPDGGPGFLILEGPDESYVQVAGGAARLIVEWRHYSEPGCFTHSIAGLPDRPSRRKVRVPTNGAHVSARENEVLDHGDAAAILEAFANGLPRPPAYLWCDMTSEFRAVGSGPGTS